LAALHQTIGVGDYVSEVRVVGHALHLSIFLEASDQLGADTISLRARGYGNHERSGVGPAWRGYPLTKNFIQGGWIDWLIGEVSG
jgi:hypothetical protein